MRREDFVNNNERSWPAWRWVTTGLNILALVLSAILSWHFLRGGTMAGCGSGSPCEQVLNSKWALLAGAFPVSGLAVGVYLALLVAGLFSAPDTETPVRSLAWKVMLFLAGAIAGSAIWFIIIQIWIIGNFCPYCMTTHTAGLLLALLIIWQANKLKDSSHASRVRLIMPLQAAWLPLAGLAMAGILAIWQAGFNPSAESVTYRSDEKPASVDYRNAPMVGSPDAANIVTLLFDYQCSHCQKIHFMLEEVVRRNEGSLAFALCPAPLNSECNPYVPADVYAFRNSCELARISMAVWVANREAFREFENWMFMFESGDSWLPRSPGSAMEKAVEMVGQAKIDSALKDPWISEYMQNCVRIYGQTVQEGKGGIPKMIFGSQWIIPEPFSADDLVRILQKSLSVPIP